MDLYSRHPNPPSTNTNVVTSFGPPLSVTYSLVTPQRQCLRIYCLCKSGIPRHIFIYSLQTAQRKTAVNASATWHIACTSFHPTLSLSCATTTSESKAMLTYLTSTVSLSSISPHQHYYQSRLPHPSTRVSTTDNILEHCSCRIPLSGPVSPRQALDIFLDTDLHTLETERKNSVMHVSALPENMHTGMETAKPHV